MSASSRRVILGLTVVGAVLAISAALIFQMFSGAVSAQEILEDAQSNNINVQTYKFTIDAWHTAQLEGDPPRFETSTEAVVVFDQGMHIIVRGNGSYGESLLLDGKQYERDTSDSAWVEYPSNFDSSQIVSLDSTKHFQIVNGLRDLTIVGEETLDGTPVRKISGGFDLQERARGIWGDPQENSALQEGSREPRQQMIAGTENFVGWVGIGDGLIHAYEVSGSYPAEGELLAFELWYRVRFSEFDQPLELPSVG